LLAAIYESPQRIRNDTDNIELLRFRKETILAGDLNAKHPGWVKNIPEPSGLKLLELCVTSNWEISIQQSPTYCALDGRGDFLDIVVHQKAKLSEVIVTETLDSGNAPIVVALLDPLTARKALHAVETLTDRERFQDLTSELIPPSIQIYSSK
jgi:hypothetical protein